MRNQPCWCGSGKKWKRCHYPQASPGNDATALQKQYLKQYGIILKTEEQIDKIRAASRLSAQILRTLCETAQVGVTTNQLNTLAIDLHKKAKAVPAPLGYGDPPYTKAICTSLNEVVCHGIPDDRPLQEGDIMNIDVSAILDGYFGDCSAMVMLGTVDPEHKRLVETTRECLNQSIEILKPHVLIKEIGATIERHATRFGYSVVNQFVGHGTGLAFHEPPNIPHHLNSCSIPLAPGMIFTIEPMINLGKRGAVIDADDHWTARTADGKVSAQWEHTVLITETGHEILTLI